ncbi:MAG: hypothetical protein ACXIU7_11095 [Roseinatronobacter sp.]
MNKTVLVAIAAVIAAIGIWFGIQSRQAPEVIEPVVETIPEPVEPEIVEPEVIEPEVVEEDAPTMEEVMESVAEEAEATVEDALEGSVDAVTDTVDSLVDDIIGDDAPAAGSEAAVDQALDAAETDLSPEAAEEAAEAIEEAIEAEQQLGLDLSVEGIRAQIDAAGLSLGDRAIIEGLLQAAGDNEELLQQVVEELRARAGL